MTNSAFRRNVAERLGIASSADIKTRRCVPTIEDAARVSEYVAGTELAAFPARPFLDKLVALGSPHGVLEL